LSIANLSKRRKRGPRGFDGGKLVKGRKRHIAVDSQGWLVRVVVHPANWADKESIRWVLRRVPLYERWEAVMVDGGYASAALAHWCQAWFGVRLEVVRRDQLHEFKLLPKRWVVERTFAWLGKCRRLSKDYEALPQVSESWVYIAMIHLMLRRLRP
jgi:putative transposase